MLPHFAQYSYPSLAGVKINKTALGAPMAQSGPPTARERLVKEHLEHPKNKGNRFSRLKRSDSDCQLQWFRDQMAFPITRSEFSRAVVNVQNGLTNAHKAETLLLNESGRDVPCRFLPGALPGVSNESTTRLLTIVLTRF